MSRPRRWMMSVITTSSAPRLEACVTASAPRAAASRSRASVAASLSAKPLLARPLTSVALADACRDRKLCAPMSGRLDEVGLGMDGITLVEAVEAVQLALGVGDVHAFAQHGHVEAAALHLHQLVDQHVAGGADFALEAQALAQQAGLAEGAAIGELGKVEVDALHAGQIQREGIGVIGRGDDGLLAFGRALVLLGGDDFHGDRKSTRLNSSHSQISYAVFCLK